MLYLSLYYMANVWRKAKGKKSVWYAQFRDANNARVNRSTHQTDRSKAQRIADEWEALARQARLGELTKAAGIKSINRIMEAAGLEALSTKSIKVAFDEWLESRESISRSTATVSRYKGILKSFYGFLGEKRLSKSLDSLTTEEVENWRNAEIKVGKHGTTADYGVTVIRGALKRMENLSLISRNPAKGVEKSLYGAETREVFTEDEVRKILSVCDEEWTGMVLLSAWHSIRLHDAAQLTWGHFDPDLKTLTYVPSKTRKKNPSPLALALSVDVSSYLVSIPRAIGKAPVFSKLFNRSSGSYAGLSNEFGRLMKKAGIDVPMGIEKSGKGRRFRKKGFHSFRHFSISRMAEFPEISPTLRRMMAGHSADSAVHESYIHMNEKNQRNALSKLPTLK